jgi:hypothetical protein
MSTTDMFNFQNQNKLRSRPIQPKWLQTLGSNRWLANCLT